MIKTADKKTKKTADKKTKKMKGLKRLWPDLMKHKGLFSFFIIGLIIATLFQILIPIFEANSLASLAENNIDKALKLGIYCFIFGFISIVLTYFVRVSYQKMFVKQSMMIKHDFINASNNTLCNKFDKESSGVFIDRVSRDVENCSSTLFDIIDGCLILIGNLGFFAYLAFLNFWLFLIILIYIVVSFILNKCRMKIWYGYDKLSKKQYEKASGSYIEQIRANRDVKCLNIKNSLIDNADNKNKVALNYWYKGRSGYVGVGAINNIVGIIIDLVILIVGIKFINLGILTLATYLICQKFSERCSWGLNNITNIMEISTRGNLAAERVFEIIDNYPKEQFGKVEIKKCGGEIEFKNVVFGYDTKNKILKGLSFKLSKNQTIAIAGESGCGKSTILGLLNRLYDIDSGEILLDGVKIQDLTENSLRDSIGAVSQDPYIFNETVVQNMRFIKSDATIKQITKCLKDAQIYDFFKKQKDGLETIIGENGKQISGGQKQRLAIARLLLKNPKVMVFDEATSALDNENQSKIVEMLNNIEGEHTIIIVAHRLSTIIDADKILYIKDGKLEAEGTHKELMKKCELYKKQYHLEEKEARI